MDECTPIRISSSYNNKLKNEILKTLVASAPTDPFPFAIKACTVPTAVYKAHDRWLAPVPKSRVHLKRTMYRSDSIYNNIV